ncbi:archaetidylserine decarboxylase [Dongshaea marina]|uniref:archaetidylserine decarboxylase n=1 Tax=Dongshaea marina TaxID=2047966 RepID=UPI000D3E61F2|nr:archaetidylserine decarboxylase [Dongshaea marina]
MSILDTLKVTAQYCMPKHLISRLVGLLAAAECGSLTQYLIRTFMKRYQISLDEAEFEQPEQYKSFNQFFTRALKEGARPICEGDNVLAQPVDGAISQLGAIKEGRIIQAKGHDFSSRTLLGGSKELAERFDAGQFATIYLAPSDYHRIHMPCDGELESMIYIPGELFSVNPLTAENVPELFARNERVVCIFKTEFGPMAMVLVGATIVASIETVWSGTVTPPAGKKIQQWSYPETTAPKLKKGDEMGRFKLGSTVVCLFPKDSIAFEAELASGFKTRMGEPLAQKA